MNPKVTNMKNLSKAYYKDYLKDIKFSLDNGKLKAEGSISENNKTILDLADTAYVKTATLFFYSDSDMINNEFSLEVGYPGLITGVGINHEAKVEGEFKLGIHLDYTSGLPVIYGSSVKGVLRSAFRYDNLFEILEDLLPEQKPRINEIQTKLKSKNLAEWSKELFGYDGEEKDLRSVYERDIFFDAIIVESPNPEEPDEKMKILSSDSITPHGKDPLKKPTPITFIRIASGCKIKFRFRLSSTENVMAEDKKDLFRFILMAFGIGAKTNVGYGRLKQTQESK